MAHTDQPKQRFLALGVGEISLVDLAANEVKYLITKRLVGENMANHEAGALPTGSVPDVAVIEKALKDAIDTVQNIVAAKSKLSPAGREQVLDLMGVLGVAIADVEKAGQPQLTAERKKALTSMFGQLHGLLKSLGVEVPELPAEKAAEPLIPPPVGASALPATATMPDGKPMLAAASKAAETPVFDIAAVAKAAGEAASAAIATALAPITARLSAVEKAQPAPESRALPEATTAGAVVKKSLWSGVL